jgi:hypothetical protein
VASTSRHATHLLADEEGSPVVLALQLDESFVFRRRIAYDHELVRRRHLRDVQRRGQHQQTRSIARDGPATGAQSLISLTPA